MAGGRPGLPSRVAKVVPSATRPRRRKNRVLYMGGLRCRPMDPTTILWWPKGATAVVQRPTRNARPPPPPPTKTLHKARRQPICYVHVVPGGRSVIQWTLFLYIGHFSRTHTHTHTQKVAIIILISRSTLTHSRTHAHTYTGETPPMRSRRRRLYFGGRTINKRYVRDGDHQHYGYPCGTTTKTATTGFRESGGILSC